MPVKSDTFPLPRIPSAPPVIAALAQNLAHRPQWSVMVPTYNCLPYLQEALESVLAQGFGPEQMQIAVIDDCSTDGDVAALVQTIGKGRVEYFQQPTNVGSLRNFETCINRSVGQWVHILHGDDLVLSGFYAEIESLFTMAPEAGAAFTNTADFILDSIPDEREPLTDKTGVIEDFLFAISGQQVVAPPSIVVKRAVYEKLGGFYAVHYGEDWEMWVRIAAHFPVAYSPRCLARYRYLNATSITHRSITNGQNVDDIIKVIDIFQKYLPADHQKRMRWLARRNYSRYVADLAHAIYYDSPESAFVQTKGALRMSKDYNVLFLAVKLYVKHIINYKEIRKLWRKDV